MPDQLKLMALDAEDLAVLSAHLQDAVLKSSEIEFDGKSGLMLLPIKRFAWEAKSARQLFFKKYERRMSVLNFARVSDVKSRGILKNTDQVLCLLAVTFTANEDSDPSGTIHLTFAGNIDMALSVECVEARLTDTGAAWTAANKPRHAV